MKINEIKTQKVDEIFDRPRAAISGFFSGKGTQQVLQQNNFIKDFYRDAITSIDGGIKNKRIDKNAPVPSSGASPAGGSAAGKGAAGKKVGAATKAVDQKTVQNLYQTIQNIDDKQLAGIIKILTTKARGAAVKESQLNEVDWADVGNKFKSGAASVGGGLAKGASVLGKGIAKGASALGRGAAAAPGAVARGAGTTVGKVQGMPAQYRGAKQAAVGAKLTPQEIQLALANIDPKQAKELLQFAKQIQQMRKTLPEGANQKNYVGLNLVFEGILNLDEAPAADPNAMSMEQFIETWFGNYMRGVNWQPSAGSVRAKIKEIADSFDGRKYDKNKIKEFASLAYNIIKTNGQIPAGAQNLIQGNAPGQPLSGGTGAGKSNASKLKTAWDQLDPKQKKAFMNYITSHP